MPSGLHWYTTNRGWVRSDAPLQAFEGPLAHMDSYTVLDTHGLGAGSYIFSFELLTQSDGEADVTSFDAVVVTVQKRAHITRKRWLGIW
jgi:hypothetical protein